MTAADLIATSVKHVLIIRNLLATRGLSRVSVQGVESLWGDCRFIPAD